MIIFDRSVADFSNEVVESQKNENKNTENKYTFCIMISGNYNFILEKERSLIKTLKQVSVLF